MKIQPMTTKFGNDAKNQYLIYTENGIYFQSYNTVIAYKSNTGEITLSNLWNCSNTTAFYRRQFLNECIEETREKISTGEYKVINRIYIR